MELIMRTSQLKSCSIPYLENPNYLNLNGKEVLSMTAAIVKKKMQIFSIFIFICQQDLAQHITVI